MLCFITIVNQKFGSFLCWIVKVNPKQQLVTVKKSKPNTTCLREHAQNQLTVLQHKRQAGQDRQDYQLKPNITLAITWVIAIIQFVSAFKLDLLGNNFITSEIVHVIDAWESRDYNN